MVILLESQNQCFEFTYICKFINSYSLMHFMYTFSNRSTSNTQQYFFKPCKIFFRSCKNYEGKKRTDNFGVILTRKR